MRFALSALLCLALAPAWGQDAALQPQGHLVIVGGGGMPTSIRKAAVELAKPQDRAVRVVVLPQASGREDRAAGHDAFWAPAGVEAVQVLDPLDATHAETLAQADLIWLPGGSQSRLMRELHAAGLVEVIQTRYRQGAVVAGSSAGAAVMGAWMLTGKADLEAVRKHATELVPGLGLWPEALVDQHFLARRRNNRLLAAVLDRPTLLGVGIDEATAVIVSGATFRVLGDGAVVVYDARQAQVSETEPGDLHAARGLTQHVLRAGDRIAWRTE